MCEIEISRDYVNIPNAFYEHITHVVCLPFMNVFLSNAFLWYIQHTKRLTNNITLPVDGLNRDLYNIITNQVHGNIKL